jgi:hypothetical protein
MDPTTAAGPSGPLGTPADFAARCMALADGCRRRAEAERARGRLLSAQHWNGFATRYDKLARQAAEYGLQQLEGQATT